MASSHTDDATDPRTDELTSDLAHIWERDADDFRDGVNYPGSEVVYEDDDTAIVADRSKSLLSHYLRGHDTPSRAVRSWMADYAADVTDHDWVGADAIVFEQSQVSDDE